MISRQDKFELQCALASQFIVAACIIVIMLLLKGKQAASSSLDGALAAIIPTRLFASLVFRHQGARQAKQIVHDFYIGEGLKLIVMALLSGAIMVYLRPIGWVFFLSLMLVYLTTSFAPLFCIRKH